MKNRNIYKSNSPWEDVYGYSRAVKVGNLIEVSGTTAAEGNQIVGVGSIYLQARHAIMKIEKTLKEAGSSLNDVVRTRTYVVDIQQWEEAAKAHKEFFGDVRPAATLVEVKSLIHPDLLIEIEVTAVINEKKQY